MASPTVLVLGAGIMGLSSAILLQKAGYTVDIWAKDLPPYTTSNKARRLRWRPSPDLGDSGPAG